MVDSALRSFRRVYGAGPVHLLGALATLAVVAVAASGWFDEPAISLKYILIWFAGAIVAHDMLLLPLYSAVDRLALSRGSELRAGERPTRPPGWVYVRVPALLSGLVLLVFGPEILRRGDYTFHVASAQHQQVYLDRYLILVAILFGLSAFAYAIRQARSRSSQGR